MEKLPKASRLNMVSPGLLAGLYGVHTNDLPDSSVYASIEMFADDSTAYCIGNLVEEVTPVLQEIMICM